MVVDGEVFSTFVALKIWLFVEQFFACFGVSGEQLERGCDSASLSSGEHGRLPVGVGQADSPATELDC